MRRLVAVAVALAAAGGLSGCGGPGSGPLGDVLTDDQQTQLAQAWVALIALPLDGATGQPVEAFGEEHAAAMDEACGKLDPAVPLLSAYADSCRLGREQITRTGPPCLMNFAERCGRAHEAQADLDRRTAVAATELERHARQIEDRACRDQIAGTDDQRRGIKELPEIADRMAAAHAVRDRIAFDRASDAYSAALTIVGPELDSTPRKLVQSYREACEPPAAAGFDHLVRRLSTAARLW